MKRSIASRDIQLLQPVPFGVDISTRANALASNGSFLRRSVIEWASDSAKSRSWRRCIFLLGYVLGVLLQLQRARHLLGGRLRLRCIPGVCSVVSIWRRGDGIRALVARLLVDGLQACIITVVGHASAPTSNAGRNVRYQRHIG